MALTKIKTSGIADNAITNAKMADDAIDSADFADGSIDNVHVATGLDAVKLADGTVTNTEFQYINTLSSNAQTQISAKAPIASPTFTGNFTSVGIDDNADATAITIDSSERVGIGTASPDTYEFLHIQKSNSENIGIKVENTGANGAHFTLRGSADSGAKYNYISSRTEGGTEHWAIAGDGTASTMVMKTGGSERMRIDSSGNVTVSTGNLVIGTAGQGVTFSDTNTPAQSAGTGSSNTLDDYEEGTFTMGFTGATFADVLHTTRHYTKIGNMVHFHYYNNGMTISSASGAARLTGLPFTSMSTAQSYSQFTTVHGNSIDGSSPGGYIDVNQTAGTFVDLNNTLSASWINGAYAYIMIQGVYSV